MIQLDPLSTILVMCHDDNTADKNSLREEYLTVNDNRMRKVFRECVYKLDDLVKERTIRDFYLSL